MEKSRWYDRLFGKRLIKCNSSSNTEDFDLVSTAEVLQEASYTGIYFSFANINRQNDEFVAKLRELYDRLKGERDGDSGKKFEVVQVVMWAHNDNYGDFESSHRESLVGLPWFAMPFSEIELKVSCLLSPERKSLHLYGVLKYIDKFLGFLMAELPKWNTLYVIVS
nr:unnamed protein product [Callosobruchus analis]